MTPQPDRKLAWITGAGKGIGRGLVKRLARDGWLVVASARTVSDLESLALECPDGAVHVLPLDVTDETGTEAMISDVERGLGPIDLAVLNAGTHIEINTGDFDVASFRTLVETNFMSVVNGLSVLVPRFIRRGRGQIAVVASLAGYRGLPSAAGYGASKAALINMCEALYPELKSKGVKLTLVNPGFVKTPLTDKNEFPMPFLVSVDEAAAAIVNGLPTNAFEVCFPRRFAFLMKVLRLLPDPLFFFITRRMLTP